MEKYRFPTSPRANPQAIIAGPQYRFTVLTDRLVRYEWAEDGQFEDRASTFAVCRDLPLPEFRVVDHESGLEIITPHVQLSYDRQRFGPAGLVAHLTARTTKYGTAWRFGTPSPLNLGGTARTLDLCDGRCDVGDGVLSKAGLAVIDDSHSMLFDGHGFVAARPAGDRVDGYLFAYGRDYRAAIRAFHAVSGNQPVVPRYALGNWWSRYYPYRQDELLQLMDRFRDRDIPLSVAVLDMEWHLVSDKQVPHAGWTGYTWNRDLFPNPTGFGQEIRRRNLKMTLCDHPHSGIHSHEDSYHEMARFLGHDTGNNDPILFDPTRPKFMEAYLAVLHRNLEPECDFWWIDWQQGPYSRIPGIDPLWMLNHFHYLDHGRDGKRPLILSRYAGPGSHRYPIGFSGDTFVTWASLEFQPEFTAMASNIGYGWWSHDIGGHIHGGRDDELVTRWLQLGVFSPILRLHSTSSRWMSKEPWLYRPECASTMSDFLRLRHRLVPFLYTQNVRGSTAHEPLVQPVYWEHPYVEEAYSVPNEYFFASTLVVVPIVQPRDKRTNLASARSWLPPHRRLVDIFTGTVYDGDRSLTLHRRLEEYPVLAPEGSIIPLDAETSPPNGCLSPDGFELVIVIGQDGHAEVVEDDPTGEPNQKVAEIRFEQASGTLTANVCSRAWKFRFLAVSSVDDVQILIDGADRTTDAAITIAQHPEAPGLLVECPSISQGKHEIIIHLGHNPQLGVIDHKPRLERLIMDYQIQFAMKDRLWECVASSDHQPLNVTTGKLIALGYDEAIVGPIAELLLADSRSQR
ncbi:putative alpha-xylosidase [Aspergillus steynii IBT 23096]|uniref:alpha-glucosidase n=1 Tax=Aspergillus steynii IBT 23096 TaxID=1392250 RepID=A0A2I2G0E5_9EURO|nr:putative alpha-xylosidase [Aspergillus steynii IBT 23096]PLB46351.1 putative alpha-xylosidase [Aspergillus steynii IBT 23096]